MTKQQLITRIRQAVLWDLTGLLTGGLRDLSTLDELHPGDVKNGNLEDLLSWTCRLDDDAREACRSYILGRWTNWRDRLVMLRNRSELQREELALMAGARDTTYQPRLAVSPEAAAPDGRGTVTVWQYTHGGHNRAWVHWSLGLYGEMKARGHRQTTHTMCGRDCDISRIGWLWAPTDRMHQIRDRLPKSFAIETWQGVERTGAYSREITHLGSGGDFGVDDEMSHVGRALRAMTDDNPNTDVESVTCADVERDLWLIE